MKRNSLIIGFSLIVLIAVNLLFFRNFYRLEIIQQKNLLFKQTQVCAHEIERVIQKFESDLNYVIFSDDISSLFTNPNSDGIRRLELFYSTYYNLVNNIDIYDDKKNVINIYRDRKQNFVTDPYIAQRQRKLSQQEQVIIQNDEYQYVLPIFKDNKLYANILVTVNLNKFVFSELKKFHVEDYTWQWVFDIDGQKCNNTSEIDYNYFGNIEEVCQNLTLGKKGLIINNISNDSIQKKLLTVYTPINVLNKLFGIGMSVDYNTFLKKIFTQLIGISSFSIIIFILVTIFLAQQVRILKKKIKP